MTGLTLSIEGGIAEIQLDDGKVNALSETMLEQLLAAIEEAAQADAALLICGRPGCFSGGYDRKLIDVLLLGDYRVGAEGDFRIGVNEVAIGMTMPDGAMLQARARLAPNWLNRCALQAEYLTPRQALEAGFFDELQSAEQLLERAREKVRQLAKLDRRAYRETRTLLHARLRMQLGKLFG